jgi:hypothetical protein
MEDFNYYALVYQGKVENVIVCSSEENFRQLTSSMPMGMFKGEWIKCTEETGRPNPDWTYDYENNKFISIKPYESWVLNENFDWVAPVPKPCDECLWDEENKQWVEFDETFYLHNTTDDCEDCNL